MDANLRSNDSATLRLLAGLAVIRQNGLNDPEISKTVVEMEELMRGRAVVKAELTGTLAAGLTEIPIPLDFRDNNQVTRENYRLFVKHAEHVS